MAYDIELISLGEDVYPVIRDSIARLNKVQDQFRFHLPSSRIQEDAASFRRTGYSTADVWKFLREQKIRFGGNRPYIIAFVNRPLKSSELTNIFGSHNAAEGFAVATLHKSSQYVKETSRYCAYYIIRYSLSFVNPLINSHTDQGRKNCYFHKKLFKPDIRASMDSGYICDEDQRQLDNPSEHGSGRRLSHEEREALRAMRLVVSGNHPQAVIMKGGGVKGLAFAGALLELEKYFWFNCHVGASAGAIAAVLLAAGYSPAELVDVLSTKNYRDFKDAPSWMVPINLLLRQWCYSGQHFWLWIESLLKSKIPKQSEILMSDLNGAVIYASRRGSGTVIFDSTLEHNDTSAAFATRCSMSIPLLFKAEKVDGRHVYDGGLRNNFPLTRFLESHPATPFIGLYLSVRDKLTTRWPLADLLEIMIEGEERQVVDANSENIVIIDTTPVGTIDFNLHKTEKDFLLKVGRASALKFLELRNLDDGPDAATVRIATSEAEACRKIVIDRRQQRRLWRVLRGFALIVIACVAIWRVHAAHEAWEVRRAPLGKVAIGPKVKSKDQVIVAPESDIQTHNISDAHLATAGFANGHTLAAESSILVPFVVYDHQEFIAKSLFAEVTGEVTAFDPQMAQWSISKNVRPGNCGDMVASGTSKAKFERISAKGYRVSISVDVALDAGEYWMSVVPQCTNEKNPVCRQIQFYLAELEKTASDDLRAPQPCNEKFIRSDFWGHSCEAVALNSNGCSRFAEGAIGGFAKSD